MVSIQVCLEKKSRCNSIISTLEKMEKWNFRIVSFYGERAHFIFLIERANKKSFLFLIHALKINIYNVYAYNIDF